MEKKFIKNLKFIPVVFLISALFVSCQNFFIKGSAIKDIIEEAVTFANSSSINASIIKNNPDDTNTIYPSGKVSGQKIGYPFEINYTSGSVFIFKNWLAVDAKGNPVSDDLVQFEDITSEKTFVTINTEEEIIIRAVSTAVPKITGHFPVFAANGVPPTTELSVTFNTPMDKNSFLMNEEQGLHKILITDSEGKDLSSYFTDLIPLSEEKLTFKFNAKSRELVELMNKGFLDVDFTFTDLITNSGLSLVQNDQSKWRIRFNNEIETNAPEIRNLSLAKNNSEKTICSDKAIDNFADDDYEKNLANTVLISAKAFDKESGVAKLVVKETMNKDTSGNDYIGTQRKSYITEVNATDFTVNNDGTIDLQDYEYTLKSNGNCAVLLDFYFEDYCGNKTDTKTYSIIKHTEVDLKELKWGNGPAVLTGGKLKFGTDYLDSLNAPGFDFRVRDDHELYNILKKGTGKDTAYSYTTYSGSQVRIYHPLYETYIANYNDYTAFGDLTEFNESLKTVYITLPKEVFYKTLTTTSGLKAVKLRWSKDNVHFTEKELSPSEKDASVFTGTIDEEKLSNLFIQLEIENSLGGKAVKTLKFPGRIIYTGITGSSTPERKSANQGFMMDGSFSTAYYFFNYDENYRLDGNYYYDSETSTIHEAQGITPYNGTYRFGGKTSEINSNKYIDCRLSWNTDRTFDTSRNPVYTSLPYANGTPYLPTYHSEHVKYRAIPVYNGFMADLSDEFDLSGKFKTDTDNFRRAAPFGNYSNVNNWSFNNYGDLVNPNGSVERNQLSLNNYIDSWELKSKGINSNYLTLTLNFKDSLWAEDKDGSIDWINLDFKRYETNPPRVLVGGASYENYNTAKSVFIPKGTTSISVNLLWYGTLMANDEIILVQTNYTWQGPAFSWGAAATITYGKNGNTYDGSPSTSSWQYNENKNEWIYGANMTGIYYSGQPLELYYTLDPRAPYEKYGSTYYKYDTATKKLNVATFIDYMSNIKGYKVYDENNDLIYNYDFKEDELAMSKNIKFDFYPAPDEQDKILNFEIFDTNGNYVQVKDKTISFNKTATSKKTSDADCSYADMARNVDSVTVMSDKPVVCEVIYAPEKYSYEQCKNADVKDFQIYDLSTSQQTINLSSTRQFGVYTYDLAAVPKGSCYMVVAYYTDGTILHTPVAVKE